MYRIFAILISIFFTASVHAQETLIIDDILSSNIVRLSDGQTVMLGGVIPKPSAKEYLIEHFEGKSVVDIPDDAIETRYGEVIVHLKTIDDIWLQKELVANGLAYAFTMPSFRQGQKELQRAEKGLNILDANNPSIIDKSVKGFQIVAGRVVDVVERGKYVYINFGDDYKTDFTISMSTSDHKYFLNEGFNVIDLKGKKIQMRGWIDHYNGPFIKLTYPEQIQIIK